MPDANGNLQYGEFLDDDFENWKLDFGTTEAPKTYLLLRIDPSGSRRIINGLRFDGQFSDQIGSMTNNFVRTQGADWFSLIENQRSAHAENIDYRGCIAWHSPYLACFHCRFEIWELPPGNSPLARPPQTPSPTPSTSSTTSRNGARPSRVSTHDFHSEFHFNHGPLSRDRRIEARPMTMTEEDMIRNGNTSQYHREIIGYIWRKMNEWGALDPATNPLWGQRPRVAIQILVDSYCAACAGRGAITRIHQRQNHLHFKQALDAGVRFFPDTSEEPYTITYISGTRTHSAFEARFDLMNYEKAVRYFQDTDGKGYETPEHVSLPEPMDFPSQTGTYATQKQEYGQYWLNEYAWLVNSDAVVDQGNTGRAILLAYRLCGNEHPGRPPTMKTGATAPRASPY